MKHPVDVIWRTMRDDLPGIVTVADGVRELKVVSRTPQDDQRLHLVTVWQAEVSLPALAAPYVDPDMFRWTDDAVWDEARHECAWSITTHHHASHIRCAGHTRYEPAMGGRGTRLTMSGDFTWNLNGIIDLPRGLKEGASRGITTFVSGLIPRNFRRVTDAVARHLGDLR